MLFDGNTIGNLEDLLGHIAPKGFIMPQIYTTHSSNLLPFIRFFEKHRVDWRKIACKHHIPEDIDTHIRWLSSTQAMAFLMDMVRHSKKRVGLEVGKLITLDQISPELDSVISRCQTLSDAIHQLIQIVPTLSSHVLVWVERINGHWYLCHRGAYHPASEGFDQTEWFRSYALLSLCRQFLGAKWVPKHVQMSFPRHLANDLPLEFIETEITFSHTFGAIRIEVEENFAPVDASHHHIDWIESVKRLSMTYGVLPHFTVDWFANLLGMSTRTLQRYLTDHGTSLKKLRDASRYHLAKQLLGNEKKLPHEVAWQCGYNDLSNFNRAFKAWEGVTPAQFRHRST
ncbi:TPA: helix-turn-helix domain-containing protein [Vibrio vulnificus]